MKNLGTKLLAVYLILIGIVSILNLDFELARIVSSLLAIASGIFIFINKNIKFNRRTSAMLLAIWLILNALETLIGINFPYATEIIAILAIASGILLLL
jgi:hypothetical protein